MKHQTFVDECECICGKENVDKHNDDCPALNNEFNYEVLEHIPSYSISYFDWDEATWSGEEVASEDICVLKYATNNQLNSYFKDMGLQDYHKYTICKYSKAGILIEFEQANNWIEEIQIEF